jgi:fucose permease
LVGVLALGYYIMKRFSIDIETLANMGIRAKLKILVSFYQIISSLQTAYGANLNEKLKNWFSALDFLKYFHIINLPRNCVGTLEMQLVISATWPYTIILFILIGGTLGRKVNMHWSQRAGAPIQNKQETNESRRANRRMFRSKEAMISVAIIVFYLALPIVPRDAFDIFTCKSFRDTDSRDSKHYLAANMSIECDDGNQTYSRLGIFYWFIIGIWPILTPLLFLALLIKVRPSVRL